MPPRDACGVLVPADGHISGLPNFPGADVHASNILSWYVWSAGLLAWPLPERGLPLTPLTW